MLSVPLEANLLERDNWTLSNTLAGNLQWLDGTFGGWLEGNAVVTPDGEIVNILRIACPDGGKAAIVRVSQDGKTVRFDPAPRHHRLSRRCKKIHDSLRRSQ